MVFAGAKVSNQELPAILNGNITHISVKNNANADNSFTFNLRKAVKSIRVMLQSSHSINKDDYEFSISGCPNALEWNMTPVAKESFVYTPFNCMSGDLATPDVVIADFSTLSFTEDSKAKLVIKDKTSGSVSTVDLVPLLLQSKSYETSNMTDQQYLNCQDNYNISFFLKD